MSRFEFFRRPGTLVALMSLLYIMSLCTISALLGSGSNCDPNKAEGLVEGGEQVYLLHSRDLEREGTGTRAAGSKRSVGIARAKARL